jgi:hypothetical protein
MSGRSSIRVAMLLGVMCAAGASCGRSVDVKQALEVVDTSSGWYDAGIVDGKNKIVPSVTFRLKKKPDTNLSGIALNVVFRHPAPDGTNVEEPWEDVFVQRVDFKDADETEALTVRPKVGYTGEPPQSRLEMLKNSQFRDVRARIFAKNSSSQWVEIGTLDVQRQLLVR